MEYKQRLLSHRFRGVLGTFPIIIIGGARQTGKSTMLLRDPLCSENRSYYTCDDPTVLLALQESPDSFFLEGRRYAIDEAQRVPEMFLALKRAVDRDRLVGRFLISGSAQFLLLKNIGDSLAGRATYLRLHPFTINERLNNGKVPLLYKLLDSSNPIFPDQWQPVPWNSEWMIRGSYPDPIMNTSADISEWYRAYETTYLDRDIRDLAPGVDPYAFHRFLRIGASRTGALLNLSDLARESGLNAISASRYMHLMETSGILTRLPPWTADPEKRWTKSPKIIFDDVTLAAHLSNNVDALSNRTNPLFGRFVESFVMQNIIALAGAFSGPKVDVAHLRTAAGFEIDCIITCGGKTVAVEVKATDSIRGSDAKNVISFVESSDA